MVIYLGPQLLTASSDLPESNNGASRPATGPTSVPASPLFDLASSGVYLAGRVTTTAGELLPHHFTLTTSPTCRRSFGGVFSVALSLTLRLVGVTDRSALRSPDFPLPRAHDERAAATILAYPRSPASLA